MKFSVPSLYQIAESITHISKRFPLVVLTSLIATITAILFLEVSFDSNYVNSPFLKAWLVGGLGISLMFALATYTEQFDWKPGLQWGVQSVGVVLLVIYFFALGDNVDEHPYRVWYRFAVYVLAAHLFAAFAPFLKSGKMDQFWEYNKTLFLRFLLSALYSGVLYIGLVIALISLVQLLELDIEDQRYVQLFVLLGGIFNTFFFLSGVPEKGEIAGSTLIFPLGLRRFAQYVLIPLVTVYIVILYLYLGKIMLQWELPNGWVSNLVLTFSIAGILSLLLLYPIRDSEENRWVRIYSKYYYLALIPLIGLLLWSIYVRISEYGVTINRYYVATLGVWLTGIVFYFILSKTKSIKVIPISLCLIALAVNFGPLGAFAVSERSQLGRFEQILDQYGYLDENGFAQTSDTGIPFVDRKELSSIADYVVEAHGVKSLNQLFEFSIQSIIEDTTYQENGWTSPLPESNQLLSSIGIEYVERWESDEDTFDSTAKYFSIDFDDAQLVNLDEFDIVIMNIELFSYENVLKVESEMGEWTITLAANGNAIQIFSKSLNSEIEIGLEEYISGLVSKYGYQSLLPVNISSIRSENEDFKAGLFFSKLTGNESETISTNGIEFNLFIKIK